MTEPFAYRVDDAAKLAGISRATIYRLITTGKLRTIKIGRRRLIPASSLHRLAEKGMAYPSLCPSPEVVDHDQ